VSKPVPQKTRARISFLLLSVITACLVCLIMLVPRCGRFPKEEQPPGSEPRPEGEAADRLPRSAAEQPLPRGEAATGDGFEPGEAATEGRPEAPRPAVPRLSVVIDDAGYSLETLQPFLEYPGPLTVAVLPNLPLSREVARRVREAGKELILHLPMEPVGAEDPGPGAIMTGQGEETIRALLEQSFDSVPGAGGANNHMGSRAMADPRVMRVVMRYFAETGRFFLDSGTTDQSRAAESARRWGVPLLKRGVFLDNEPGEIASRLEEGFALARTNGSAVLIGHVKSPEILAELARLAPQWRREGAQVVALDELLEAAGEGTAP